MNLMRQAFTLGVRRPQEGELSETGARGLNTYKNAQGASTRKGPVDNLRGIDTDSKIEMAFNRRLKRVEERLREGEIPNEEGESPNETSPLIGS